MKEKSEIVVKPSYTITDIVKKIEEIDKKLQPEKLKEIIVSVFGGALKIKMSDEEKNRLTQLISKGVEDSLYDKIIKKAIEELKRENEIFINLIDKKMQKLYLIVMLLIGVNIATFLLFALYILKQ